MESQGCVGTGSLQLTPGGACCQGGMMRAAVHLGNRWGQRQSRILLQCFSEYRECPTRMS